MNNNIKNDSKSTLLSLRDKFNSGKISETQFLLNASESYLECTKPLRARCLFKIINKNKMTYKQSLQYDNLKNSIEKFAPLPYQTCSLNIITRNEENNIAGALDSVDTIMDEIVVCDTGSKDRTVELAKQYGIVIIHDLWQNDFSRARNNAIEASSSEWIFWMDADDRLDESSLEPLQKLWREGSPQGAAFCIANERKNSTPLEFMQVRLFPNRPCMRFEQRIHEQIMFSAVREKIPFTSHPEIRIHHEGYMDSETHRKKALRNKPLIQAELKNRPSDPTLQLSLGDCYFSLDDIENAMEIYRSVANNNKAWQINSDVFVQAHLNLATLYAKQKNMYEAKRYLLRTLYLDNKRIEALFALARIYLKEGNENDALAYFIKSARVSPPLRMTPADNLRIRLESIYNITTLLIKQHRYIEAEKILLPAIKQYPQVPEFYTQMGNSLLPQNKLEQAARFFTASLQLSPVNNHDAYKGMAEIYSILGDNKIAESYLKSVNSRHKTAVSLNC